MFQTLQTSFGWDATTFSCVYLIRYDMIALALQATIREPLERG